MTFSDVFLPVLASPFDLHRASAERSFRKKTRNLNKISESFAEICPEIRPEISGAFLAGQKVLPPNFTRYFTSEISNFKSNFTKKLHNALLRGHLTCTNKCAQAAEQKIARDESFLALPAMHLLCMCSMLVPSEFSHLRKRSAKKLHFCTFLGNCSISESAKKLQKLFGSALSHLIICCLF